MRISRVMMDSIHISTTYGGSLEGRPPKKYMIDKAKESAVEMYGKDRPLYIAIPEGNDLPTYQYVGWFSSYTPVNDEDAFGSHLVVIWWDDKQTLDGAIDFAAAHWGHAKDFDI